MIKLASNIENLAVVLIFDKFFTCTLKTQYKKKN